METKDATQHPAVPRTALPPTDVKAEKMCLN
jgi:hypothetical protein